MQSTGQENRGAAKRESTVKADGAVDCKSQKGKSGKITLVIILVLIVSFLTIFMVYVRGYDKVYPNTYTGDINLGGMTVEEAFDMLNSQYSEEKLQGETMPVGCKDREIKVSLSDLGVRFDNVAFAEQVMNCGREGSLLQDAILYIKHLFINTEVEPVMTYDKDSVLALFDEVTAGYEIEPVGHTFEIGNGEVTIHGAVNGVKADRETALTEFESQIAKMKITGIELVPESTEPEEINVDEFYKWLTSDAQNSYYEKIDGKVMVHDSKPKCEVKRKDVEAAIDGLGATADNMVTIPAVIKDADITAEELTANLYKDELGGYSTNFGGSSAARANNVKLATERINGVELMPGEEFSYDKTILSRTAENGYMAAPVYVGNKVESGMGGGICQPSSTLYAAALYANLEILERHNHSLAVGYLPLGMDATIAEGVLDFRFSNSTEYPIKVVATADNGVVTFKIMGYNPKNISVDVLRSSSNGVYYVTRVVKENGVEIGRENMTSSRYGKEEKDEPKPEEKPKQTEAEETKPTEEPAPAAEQTAAVMPEPEHTAEEHVEQAVPPKREAETEPTAEIQNTLVE